MKFYDREKELLELHNLWRQTESSSKMAVLTGRRRVGKTLLSLEFSGNSKHIYLFVSKKSEHLLCLEFLDQIKKAFEIPVIGEIRNFRDVFTLLMEISKKERYTLIIDEFQEFFNINPSVYSEMQNIWDLNKNKCRLNLILIGSVYSLMRKIFQNAKEPLFGRADRIFYIRPFSIKTIGDILTDYDLKNVRSIFDLYLFTGGLPKYIEMLLENSAFSRKKIIDFFLDANSPFLHEGKNLLIEEFGRDYGIYFSILELISCGKTSRHEIESMLEKDIGGYLEHLENDYSLISRIRPINAKPGARSLKYRIIDNFLNFWFRFIYKNRSAVETGNFNYIREIIERDFQTYSGRILESFFHEIFAETGDFNRIGSFWEKGNLNEIDMVALNEKNKTILLAEVKLNKVRLDIKQLEAKAKAILPSYPGYTPELLLLSLDDAEKYLL
jgi:AAA+ ATPase superfamily predicted ATPase